MMMKMDFSFNVNHLFYINMSSYMINKNLESNEINSHILYKDQTIQIVRCKYKSLYATKERTMQCRVFSFIAPKV